MSERDPGVTGDSRGDGPSAGSAQGASGRKRRLPVAARVTIDRRGGAGSAVEDIVRDVRAGLTARPPSIPAKYLYDDRGSRLFEEITRLPEYYQTRTEERLLEEIAPQVIELTRGNELVELGSGAGRKVRLLLDAMDRCGSLQSCTLFDINESFLSASARRLAAEYRDLRVRGIVGDFTRDLAALGREDHRLVVFLAGTFGNLDPGSAPAFLKAVRATLGRRAWFLVGLDLVKDVAVLERAYNDAAGVTAAFNLNVLLVLNARLGADFDPAAFEHIAFYDAGNAWIEMRARARRAMQVHLPAAHLTLELDAGEEIRTEISCKYTRESFAALLPGTGLELRRWFRDSERRFALALVEAVSPVT